MGGEPTCRDDTPLRVADEVVGPDKIGPLGEVLGKCTARDVHRARAGSGQRGIGAVKHRAHNEGYCRRRVLGARGIDDVKRLQPTPGQDKTRHHPGCGDAQLLPGTEVEDDVMRREIDEALRRGATSL
ncbi:hypothetical protein HMPREF2883_09555 [Actinomyces sp. HMSC075C01]|uniref:Uncharacterized protein n=1 Tax=Actinomyces oris TaxID=544580 RepID=A0A1Q8VUE3_9ACTO|nr:hypothetical protein HMPREF2883_09555 [Actinomyces sp. HMSC075C01]OLO51692.1 hypothetical protein BKH27_11500 [Actinomyces oris]